MVETKDLLEQNPWWRIKDWYEFDKHLLMLKDNPFQARRNELIKISQVNLIYGPRQVGKTTLIKLMINELIKDEAAEKIAYFSCDTLITNKRGELREVINFFLNREIKYLFIDEISNVNDWGYEVKYFIDAGKFNSLKVFITGSPFGMNEHLPGRKIKHFYLMPLTFREILSNLALNLNENLKKVFNLNKAECEEIKYISNLLCSTNYNFIKLNEGLEKKIRKIEAYSPFLEKLFYFYLITGGFPSVINGFIKYGIERSKTHLLEEIKTSKERLIDSLRKAGKNEGICFQLINSVKKRLSSRYSFTQLKETEIDLSKETIINYLNHLKNIFVLKVIYAYNFGKGGVGWKKNKKIYLLDPFLYHEEKILESDNLLIDDEYLSKIVESVTAINLSYLKEDFFNPLDTFLFFWYNAKEIDFVIYNKEPIAIEVKFRKKISKLYKISQVKNYLVLTKNMLHFNDKEIYVPAYLFMSLLKNKEGYL